jgi:cysteine desulfurase
MTVYLDYNASTPIDPRVLDEMITVYKEYYGNASSRTNIYGQRANEIVKKGRARAASVLSIDYSEVIFTSGATESNNIAILGLARWGEENNRKHIISTRIEHKAVLEPLSYLAGKGFEVDLVGVDKSGRVNPKDVFEKMRPDTLLVTIMHANNETGVIQPVKEIGDALYDTPTYFHVDAAQTFGKLVPELRELKYDMLSISGHKVYGPQGIGALVLRRKAYRRPPVKPIMFGGGQEVGLRPGTLPVALIAGLGKASEISENEYIEWHKKVSAIKEEIIKQLEEVEYIINGDQKHCMPHTLSVSFPGINSEALMIATQDYCAISNGSACTSHDYKPSHVLTAMGLDEEIVSGTVRISWGPSTGKINLSGLINTVLRMKG